MILLSLLLIVPFALAQAPDEVTHLSSTSIEQLHEFENEHVSSTTLAFYPTSMFVLCIIMYLSAHAVAWCLHRWTKEFRNMSFANQRTSVIYILSIFFTGSAFGIQMACFGMWTEVFTVWNIKLIRAVGSIVTTLYIFELSYRSSMRLQMQIHHITTVFAIMFTMASIDATKDPSMFVTALAWLLQATTEQGIFTGLLMYRFKCSPTIVPRVLRWGAMQALLSKVGSGIYIFVWWGERQARHSRSGEIAFSVVLVLAMSLLMFTQFYGTWVVWKIASSYERRYFADGGLDAHEDSPELEDQKETTNSEESKC